MGESRHEHSQVSDSQTGVNHTEEPLAAAPPPETESISGTASEIGGIFDLAGQWVSNAGSRVKAMVELVLAEARLAAISVALMVFLAMLSAAFILGAWALMIAGLIYGLLQMGLPLWPILLTLCAAHGLIAYLAWRGAVKLSANLEFPVTRQQLQRNEEDTDEMAKSKTQG